MRFEEFKKLEHAQENKNKSGGHSKKKKTPSHQTIPVSMAKVEDKIESQILEAENLNSKLTNPVIDSSEPKDAPNIFIPSQETGEPED
jgi:hypothetical protein